MRCNASKFAISVLLVGMTLPSLSWAKSQLEERLNRIENIVSNEFNIDLINQLATLQSEIQELRGKVEEQQNELQLLSKKQDKLFTNLDSRLVDVSKNKKLAQQDNDLELEEEDEQENAVQPNNTNGGEGFPPNIPPAPAQESEQEQDYSALDSLFTSKTAQK